LPFPRGIIDTLCSQPIERCEGGGADQFKQFPFTNLEVPEIGVRGRFALSGGAFRLLKSSWRAIVGGIFLDIIARKRAAESGEAVWIMDKIFVYLVHDPFCIGLADALQILRD